MTVLPPYTLREFKSIEGEDSLRCSKCKTWKPVSNFGRKPQSRSGYQSHCKSCNLQACRVSREKAMARKLARRAEMAQEASSSTLAQFDSPKPKTRQKPIMRQRKAIRKVSAKRKQELEEYSRLRKVFLESNPRCTVFPNRKSTQVHHVRSREGPWLLRQEDWLAVSDEGHEWIHQNPESAKQRGFLKLRITTDQLKNYEHTD